MRVKGKKDRNSTRTDRWKVLVWFLDLQGALSRGYTQTHHEAEQDTKLRIYRYEGEQDVTSLKIIPREFWDAIDNGARRAQFEARGAKKFELMTNRF